LKIRIKTTVQILFLIGFITFMLTDKIQLWLIFLIMGFCISFFAGRIYCGWCCPVNGMNRLTGAVYNLVSRKKRNAPIIFSSKYFRTIWFALLLGLVILSAITGRSFSVFAIITIMGILMCTVFTSSFWCRYLCPWAVLFQNSARYSPIKRDNENCRAIVKQ
jgi:polyferredoxin